MESIGDVYKVPLTVRQDVTVTLYFCRRENRFYRDDQFPSGSSARLVRR